MGETHVSFKEENGDPDPDVYNKEFNPDSETEVIHIAHEAHPVRYKSKPYDWFICSVLGYVLCPCVGICAMYYAVRANHAVDWERDEDLIRNHTEKAKCLTLTSIVLGTILMITFLVLFVLWIHFTVAVVEAIMQSMQQPPVPQYVIPQQSSG